jgi:hypothetical protein
MLFCDRHEVVEYQNIRDFAIDLACGYPSLKACTSASPGGGFQGRLGALELDELRIFSCAYTPMHSEVGHRESIEVRLPILGHNMSRIEGKPYHWGSGLGALFTPAKVGNANQEGGCTLSLVINEARLEKTAHAMLGLPLQQPLNLQLEQPRVMPLHLGKIDMIRSFQQMSHFLAPYRTVPPAIAAIGVEDFVYRHAVLMLRIVPTCQRRLNSDPVGQFSVGGNSFTFEFGYINANRHSKPAETRACTGQFHCVKLQDRTLFFRIELYCLG